jgi:phospho-N-acetylmuramoyl-pentapeptide-transferase
VFYNIFKSFFITENGTLLHFAYLLFRSFGALFTSLVMNFLLTSKFIKISAKEQRFQPIRNGWIERHFITKSKTPTMGGLPILISIILSLLLWSDLKNQFVWISIFVMLTFSSIGAIDDLLKIYWKDTDGLSARTRIILQFIIAAFILIWLQLINKSYADTNVTIPFLKIGLNLGLLYWPFATCIIVGSANAVNITDGLDGLVIVPIMMAATALGVLCATAGSKILSAYIKVPHIEGIADLAILSCSIIGSGLAFLWFNIHPAKIFMGDVGSLMLGAILGVMSIMVKHEIFYAIIGMLFVIEALSTIIQVWSWKFRKKPFFLMAPIHHHFEKLGWNEEKIVVRFWIFAVICALIGIAGII